MWQNNNERRLEYFVSWKDMGPEHNKWLPDSELNNAAELVQEYLDSLEPQARPAAHVGRPMASESQVIPSDVNAQGTSRRGRLRKHIASGAKRKR